MDLLERLQLDLILRVSRRNELKMKLTGMFIEGGKADELSRSKATGEL